MSARRASPFSRVAVLGMVVIGFIAFIAMLYFLSVGDTGESENDGNAHAAANGLNGYSGLARMLEAEGYDVELSRIESNLKSPGLLVLTPPAFMDGDDLNTVLEQRAYIGPTLVLVPKWIAFQFPPNMPLEVQAEIEDGWVQLGGATAPRWLEELQGPMAIDAEVAENASPTWAGLEGKGSLPENRVLGAAPKRGQNTLVLDGSARGLAITMNNVSEFGTNDETEPVTFVIEPDLVNNYGLSDAERAALALRLVEEAGYGVDDPVTFDLTLNGLGGTVNLLTLAFRPPFLAATLCLLLAMVIIGWRAFKRFGPPVSDGPAIAFGKSRLVTNGAGLILRARRLRLLAGPYIDLSARRIADAMGLTRHDAEAIDDALRRRLPNEEPFSNRAARLREATKSSDILRAAQALKELEGKLHK